MKKLIFLLATGALSVSAFAQNGFYITTFASVGLGNAKRDYPETSWGYALTSFLDKKPIFTYRAGFLAGYKSKHARVELGFQYSTSGYKHVNLAIRAPQKPLGDGFDKICYSHLSVPLRLGYEFKIANKLQLVPYIGLAASYNLGTTETTNTSGEGTKTFTWTKEKFDYNNKRVSLWWNVSTRLEYTYNKHFSIFAGPTLEHMISNFSNEVTGMMLAYYPPQRNYNYHFDIGAIISL